MSLGFARVFAANSFAIARILGVLRTRGGPIQETAGRPVQTLEVPFLAKAFIVLMATAMMILLVAVVVHVILARRVAPAVMAGDNTAVAMIQVWAIRLEGLRRFGAATYLLSISLGLAPIFQLLGFQSIPAERASDRDTAGKVVTAVRMRVPGSPKGDPPAV